ncbi:MAG: rhodanese-like domain-containing protein [Chromatiales bacterium]|nr:rhodanese-like domain-containing protein [Chromatiales bacterium]
MLTYRQLIADRLKEVEELFPWDVDEKLQSDDPPLLLDIREPYEYDAMHIRDSINVPRGVLEQACEWGYMETLPDLVNARDKEVVVICRSGNRSVLAAFNMQLMGYTKVYSMKTGLRGWNDFELPLMDAGGAPAEIDDADEYFTDVLTPEQMPPNKGD